MAKITDFETPLGQKGNILQPMTWLPLILGGVVLLGAFSASQRIGAAVGSKLPFIDTTPNNPWQVAPTPTAQNQTMYFG